MQAQQASENRAKARDVDRGGVGDVDNNTPVLPRTSSGTALANACMNAETDGKYNSQLDSAAQGAHLCLLAAKSPKSNIYKTYDKTRRSRSFIPHWVVEYPWLEFNPEKECMFCVYCREYQRTHDPEFTNTFVHGATNFRLDSVKAHDHSTKHRQVMLVMSGRIASVPKPASKQASKASRQSSTGKGMEDRLRVGAFFDSEVDAGYDDSLMMGTHVSSVHKTHDDEGNQRRVTPSSDLTDEPFYPPNPMTKYIKTLQNIYPHLPVSEMASSETHPATTTIPQQLSSQSSTSSSSQAEDIPQQVIGQEERGEEQYIKDEPMSPGLEEQAQMESHGEKEQDAGEDPPSLTGGGRIGRAVPPMMKAWQVNKNEVSTMLRVEEDEDGETADEYEQTGDDAAVNRNLDDEVDQEYDGEAEEGLLQRSGAMTDFFINPVVPVYRQGKRTTRLLPKAKRQKLEMIMARRMQGEDIVNGGEDSLGDQHFQSESDVDVATSSSSDPHWKRLAESFAARYNQLCEEHTNLMKLFQTKVSSLEKKCNDLEEACKAKQRESLTNSSQQDGIHGGQGSSHSSPRINMYSSVIVLQMQGQDPVNIRSNSDADFNRVQQNLSQSGIHISLGTNNIPNTIEQQLGLHSRAGGQRSHATSSSPSAASSRKTEVAATCTSENASRYNVSPERVKISSGTGIVDPELVSGVGSNLQYDLEMQKSDLSAHHNQTLEKHGYLMGNGTVLDGAELSGNEPSASLSRTSVNDGIARETSHGNNPAKTLAEPLMDVAGDQVSVSCPQNSLTTCTDASSNDDGIV